MTPEEKAKAYDKAINVARSKIKNDKDHVLYEEDITDIFPELKENENEKIRKELIETIHLAYDCGFSLNKKQHDKYIAWIEKQGEHDSIEEPNFFDDFRKTDSEVEPKFKAGDWIVFNGFTLYVKEVVKGFYRTISKGGIVNSHDWNIDNVARLWTIQDAKDGDVLATDSWLYIFKHTNNKAIIQFYCNCPINGKPYKWSFLSDDSYLDIYKDANIHPATKEQRDILFQKMREEGYEWDAEKKELKEILRK